MALNFIKPHDAERIVELFFSRAFLEDVIRSGLRIHVWTILEKSTSRGGVNRRYVELHSLDRCDLLWSMSTLLLVEPNPVLGVGKVLPTSSTLQSGRYGLTYYGQTKRHVRTTKRVSYADAARKCSE